MKKIVLLFLLLLVLGGLGVYLYVNYKPHRNVESEEVAVKVSAMDLFDQYSENNKKSDSLYLNKIIEVNGIINEMDKDQKGERLVILKKDGDIFGVVCYINEVDADNKKLANSMKLGDKITLKGICSGFDSDVKLTKCLIVTNASKPL